MEKWNVELRLFTLHVSEKKTPHTPYREVNNGSFDSEIPTSSENSTISTTVENVTDTVVAPVIAAGPW